MGIDLTRLCNHNLQFKNQDEFVTKFSKAFKSAVYPFYQQNDALKEIDGTMYLDEADEITIQNKIDKNDYFISMYVTNINHVNGYDYFYTNSHCIDLNHDEYYIGRWNSIKWITDYLKNEGFPNAEYYLKEPYFYHLHNRRKYYDFVKTIGANESVIFCDDHHPEWLDMLEQNCTLNDFINWGKKELIYVDFKDLPNFNFPDNKPDYYNVFIYDSFEDLKAMDN